MNIPTKDRAEFYAYYDEYYAAGEKMSLSENGIENYRIKEKIKKSSFYQIFKPSTKKTNSKSDLNYDEKVLLDIGIPEEKIIKENHHFCHASAVYYGLSTDISKPYLVFSLDGGGDGLTAAVYKAYNGQLELLSESNVYSIGNIYSATTYFLGFTPHEHEYKLMGLAPYVKDDYAEKCLPFFRKFLHLNEDNTEFHNPEELNHAIFFAHLIKGLKRERFDNVSAGLQMFCEEIVSNWIKGKY